MDSLNDTDYIEINEIAIVNGLETLNDDDINTIIEIFELEKKISAFG